ncbi:calpain-5-like [Gigantopelta aegis]|uniref:calpain-5-like n=1 Tax=Gigantopelta aegis TaxID=1735272 RepID=UPI001B88D268|nr:calpain-5-like [Gigantopelta aegis]
MPNKFRNQNYANLKQECIKKGQLFEDPEFTASNKSVFFSKVDNDIEWKRPKELCHVPKLILDGVACENLVQGELGNAWFITACSSLALEQKLWRAVVPNYKEQEWSEKNEYAGIFHFAFFRYGSWTEVVIDDRLPTKNGNLVFCHSKSKNEFWSALLEKAYAKLYGDYESLRYGFIADALVDFTAGISERIVISELNLDQHGNKGALLNKLLAANRQKAFIVCSIKCPEDKTDETTTNGLQLGKGYHLTQVKGIKLNDKLQQKIGSERLNLIRIYNPWDMSKWNGPWSDQSSEWQVASTAEWENMGIMYTQESEFWISFSDFINNFTNIDICHFVNTSLFKIEKTWSEAIIRGKWVVDPQASSDFQSFNFLKNPQVLFDVTSDEDTVMLSLEQQDVSAGRKFLGDKLNSIGFQIMKVEENRKYRVHVLTEKVHETPFQTSRSVFGSCLVKKGRYVLLPALKEADHSADFLLRLYSTKPSHARQLLKDEPTVKCPCVSGFSIISTLTVISATGIELPSTVKGDCNPLVILKCEGEKVKSASCQNTTSPVWDMKATFYRKKKAYPIKLELWNYSPMLNSFIAETYVRETGYDDDGVTTEYELWEKNKTGIMKRPGMIQVHIKSSSDIISL